MTYVWLCITKTEIESHGHPRGFCTHQLCSLKRPVPLRWDRNAQMSNYNGAVLQITQKRPCNQTLNTHVHESLTPEVGKRPRYWCHAKPPTGRSLANGVIPHLSVGMRVTILQGTQSRLARIERRELVGNKCTTTGVNPGTRGSEDCCCFLSASEIRLIF